MGRRYRNRYRNRYYRSHFTAEDAKYELALGTLAGILLIPVTFGLSLLIIPLVALHAWACVSPPLRLLPSFPPYHVVKQKILTYWPWRKP